MDVTRTLLIVRGGLIESSDSIVSRFASGRKPRPVVDSMRDSRGCSSSSQQGMRLLQVQLWKRYLPAPWPQKLTRLFSDDIG